MRMFDSDSVGNALNRLGGFLTGKLGINTGLTPTSNQLMINTPNTADTLAEAIITTSATTRKGLVVQQTSGQSANLVEFQNNSGGALSAISSSGQFTGSCSGTILSSFLRFARATAAGASGSIGLNPICGSTYSPTGAQSITLPAASNGSSGNPALIMIVDEGGQAATHNITISPAGSDTINGAASLVLNTNYQAVILYGFGTTWFTVSKS